MNGMEMMLRGMGINVDELKAKAEEALNHFMSTYQKMERDQAMILERINEIADEQHYIVKLLTDGKNAVPELELPDPAKFTGSGHD